MPRRDEAATDVWKQQMVSLVTLIFYLVSVFTCVHQLGPWHLSS